MADTDRNPEPYTPTEPDRKRIAEVEESFERWTIGRRPHESQWYLNGAFYRGQQWVQWNNRDNRLDGPPPGPAHRVRSVYNILQAKVRARIAKFLRERMVPQVIPASTDVEDKLDARATQKGLDYLWRRVELESKYRKALIIAATMGHAYWWLSWDPTIEGRVKVPDPMTGDPQVLDAVLGDVVVEVGSPFEVLVANPGISDLGDQPKIMRIKARSVDEVKRRWPNAARYVAADTDDQAFYFERQLAALNSRGLGGFQMMQDTIRGQRRDGTRDEVIVKELFCRPTAEYPKGSYTAVAGGVLLTFRPELPYGFSTFANPYPVVDFVDMLAVGQYWNTCTTEQLIPVQKSYNTLRSRVEEQLAVMSFPKLIAAKQHKIPEGAWTSAPGEFIEYFAHPNIPPPFTWEPPNIASDTWRALDINRREFEDISHIYAEASGQVGKSQSGFQTSLLQEAMDAVHGPDIRGHALAIEEFALKARRLMKRGYGIPRLITVAGRDLEPEVLEFSAEEIDEHADIRIEAVSALPSGKAAKIQAILELWSAGIMGNPQDPEAQRKVLQMLELGTINEVIDPARRDEEQARMEDLATSEGREIAPADFWENHDVHYRVHTDDLKGSQASRWPPEVRQLKIAHVISHARWQNPDAAIQLATTYGMPQLVEDLIQQKQTTSPPAPSPEQPANQPAMPTMEPSPMPPAPGEQPGAVPQPVPAAPPPISG